MKIKYTMFSLLLLASIMHNICAMELGDSSSDQGDNFFSQYSSDDQLLSGKSMKFARLNPSGTHFASGGSSGIINIKEMGDRQFREEHKYKMGKPVLSACWDSTGEYLIVNSEEMALKVIDAKNKCIDEKGESVSGVNVTAICFSPDDTYCMTAIKNDSNLYLAQGKNRPKKIQLTLNDCINEICCSRDNTFFAACSNQGFVYVYKVKDEEFIHLNNHVKIYSIDVDPSGKYLAFGDEKGYIKILDVANKCVIYKHNIESNFIASVRWSKTGEYIAVVSHDGTLIAIWKWSNKQLECVNIIYVSGQRVASKIDWSADDTSLLIGYEDETIEVHDIHRTTSEKTVADAVFNIFSTAQYMTPEQKKDKLLSIFTPTLPLSLQTLIKQQLPSTASVFNSI